VEAAVPEELVGGSKRLFLHPNPMSTGVSVVYALPKSSGVHLRVLDAEGHVIRTLVDGTRAAGTHKILWDGTNDNGTQVACGVYWVRLEDGGYGRATGARRIVVMR
jgi:flagellar hook assembly protein FlgD